MSAPHEQTSPYPDAGAARGGDRSDPRPAPEPEGTITAPSTVLEHHNEPVATSDDSVTTEPGEALP